MILIVAVAALALSFTGATRTLPNDGSHERFLHTPAYSGTVCFDPEATIAIEKAYIAGGEPLAEEAERTLKQEGRCVNVVDEWGGPIPIGRVTVLETSKRDTTRIFVLQSLLALVFEEIPLYFLAYED